VGSLDRTVAYTPALNIGQAIRKSLVRGASGIGWCKSGSWYG